MSAQQAAAREKAHNIRLKRYRLRTKIKSKDLSIAKVLLDPPEFIHNMKLTDLLLAIPQFGDSKIDQVFKKYQYPPMKTVGSLTERQRKELAEYFNPTGGDCGES